MFAERLIMNEVANSKFFVSRRLVFLNSVVIFTLLLICITEVSKAAKSLYIFFNRVPMMFRQNRQIFDFINKILFNLEKRKKSIFTLYLFYHFDTSNKLPIGDAFQIIIT